MKITRELLLELQNRLKIGNRRGVHLNAIPGRSKYKFDISRLSNIDKDLPNSFINDLISKPKLKFKISWKDNVPDLNLIDEDDQIKLVKITRSFQNLINQTKVIESEKGVNTFGFGYPLLIRRDESDNKITVAPILIWSLKIRKAKDFNTWEILRTDEDSIYINEVLINHLYKDSNIKIEQLSSELLDDGFIDKGKLLDVCVKLIKSINTQTSGEIGSNFEKKINEAKKIPTKKYLEQLPLLGPNNSLVHFGGLFSIFEVQKQNIIKDYEYLFELGNKEIDLSGMEKHFFQPISSIETDPSQQSILNALESTRNILIQGPPGTGKSQSLTSILVNALENNKKTIVVCEKKAALDVLKDALTDKGLENHFTIINDIVSDRRKVVESVRNRTFRNIGSYARYNLDYLIENTNLCINAINNKHIKLSQKILDDKNWTDIVGILLSEEKNFSENSGIELKKINFSFKPNEFNRFIDIVEKGQNLYNDYKDYQKLSFINPIKYLDNNPFSIKNEIEKDFSRYKKEIYIIQNLVSRYKGLYYDIRLREFEGQRLKFAELKKKLDKTFLDVKDLLSEIKRKYFSIRINDFNEQYSKVLKEIKQVDGLYIKYEDYENLLLNRDELNSYSYKLKSFFSKKIRSVKEANEIIDLKIEKIESQLSQCHDLDNFKFSKNLKEKKKDFYSLIEILKGQQMNFKSLVDKEIQSMKLSTFMDSEINYQSCITEIGLLRKKKFYSKYCKNYLLEAQKSLIVIEKEILSDYNKVKLFTKNAKDLKTIDYHKLLNHNKNELLKYEEYLNKLESDFKARLNKEIKTLDVLKCDEAIYENDTLKEIKNRIGFLKQRFTKDNWVIGKISFGSEIEMTRDFNNLFKKCDAYFNHEENLILYEYKWFEYYNSLTSRNKKLIDQLKGRSDWVKVFKVHYLKSLLDDKADMDLPTDNKEYDDLDNKLNNFKSEQLNYIRQFWQSKQKEATLDFQEKHSGFSVNNIYNLRKNRNFKRLSLREIVKFDLDFFTTMFPIILTTPDVCSNLFKNKNKYFDIIMFDEASQLRLEHTLPALLKGKQIVIAGDEHQMPPSNYFSPILDGEIEDEDEIEEEEEITVDANNILLSCESLLDFATEFKFEKKYLDFHYRSEHPYLIDFSNYAFYNQRLKPRPNEIDYTPIKYIPVNGTYSDNSNEAEAETVLSIIDKNIQRLPDGKYPSVGVATFNISQRNLIMNKINERKKLNKYSDFNNKILELDESGFFVKNLENIQGDERDIIILSTTYGVNKDGNFQNRFGPINFAKGYKLLNVIITRAKYKIYLCSSIPEEHFLNYKNILGSIGSNNRRGAFFAYLAYSKAVSEGDNELRESVLKALAENTNIDDGPIPVNQDLESPFEEEVYQALLEHFNQDNIIPQHQFAGFRIDIVYDPKHSGLPKIAIECDGATYHSSREAWLHDRHRQKILEGHGFVFHRIWSPNWWKNSKTETKKMVDFIKGIENRNPSLFLDKSNIIDAFTDDVVIAKNNFLNDSLSSRKKIDDTAKAFKEQELVQKELFGNNEKQKQIKDQEKVIKLNSKVVVKYINNGEKYKVYLVDEQIRSTKKINGYQKTNIKSSLGVSLLGKKKGDVERVGKGDYYVEVLEILN